MQRPALTTEAIDLVRDFEDVWLTAMSKGLKGKNFVGMTTLGPRTPTGYPMLIFKAGPKETVLIGPHGSTKYTSLVED